MNQQYHIIVENPDLAELLKAVVVHFHGLQEIMQKHACTPCTMLHRIGYGLGILNLDHLISNLTPEAYARMAISIAGDALMIAVINTFLEKQHGKSDDEQQGTEGNPDYDGGS